MNARMEYQGDQLYVSPEAAPGLGAAITEIDDVFQRLDLAGEGPDFGRPGALPEAHDLVRRDREIAEAMAESLAALRSGVDAIGRSVLTYVDQVTELDRANARDLSDAYDPGSP